MSWAGKEDLYATLRRSSELLPLFSIRDSWETFLLSIVCSLLVDSEKSPFYKKLIIPNIGTNYSPDTGYVSISGIVMDIRKLEYRSQPPGNISCLGNSCSMMFATVFERKQQPITVSIRID